MMDRTGIPLAYELFPGNDSEKLHMLPIVKRAKRDFGFARTICVADRGLNTSDNIYFLNGDNKVITTLWTDMSTVSQCVVQMQNLKNG